MRCVEFWESRDFSPLYRSSHMNPEVLQRAIDREKKRRLLAESLLEEKSRELYLSFESLKKTNDDLASAMAEVKSQQRQLVQSEKMASLGVMSAGVAHEINNPLAYVLSNINSLDQTVGKLTQYHKRVMAIIAAHSEEQRKREIQALELFLVESDLNYQIEDSSDLIADTIEGVSRVKAIVSGLQSFAHSDSGVMVSVDIHECIISTLKLARTQIRNNVDVQVDFGDLPEILGYPSKLAQVILNLLINASHALDRQETNQSGEIIIKTRYDGDAITVAVTDTGCGMTQSTIGNIFMPFYTTKEVGKGTGLGLAISHGIIEEHQGTIEVESTLGVGTTFTLRLPVTLAISKAA